MLKPKERVCRVLLAEDSPTDIKMFQRAVRKSPHAFDLQVVIDGEQALDFLEQRGEWSEAWRPDLFVLSINMPKIGGWEVLQRMKDNPALRTTPVAIWSIAQIGEYADRAFDMGCSGIFTKPVDEEHFESQVQSIVEFYWWAWSDNRRSHRDRDEPLFGF